MGDIVQANPGRSGLILAISIALGFLFDYFFWSKVPGIGFGVYMVLIIGALFGIARYTKKPVRGDVLWLLPLLIFFSAMVGIRASPLLGALNILASLLLLLIISEVSVRGALRRFIPWDYLQLLFTPFKYLDPLIRTCADVLSLRRMGDRKKTIQVIRGVLIAAPILVVFAILFSSADVVFETYLSRFIDWNIKPETVFRGFLICAVTLSFIGAYAYSFTGTQGLVVAHDRKRTMGHIETAIILGSVNALFLLFLSIQVTYLFGGESNIAIEGFTYAEYARQGFFELIAVAIFSYLILLTVEKYIERDTEHHSPVFKYLSAALVLQVAVIMVSAFFRLSLYEDTFGFTTLRLYSHAFIILLGFVFALLLYKILIENKDSTFAFRIFLAIVVFLVGMNIFNPDAFIAKKNLERYATTGKLDTAYLSSLSADATPVLVRGIDNIEDDINRSYIGQVLYSRYSNYLRFQAWQSWNVSREHEKKLLASHLNKLSLYKDYVPPQETTPLVRIPGEQGPPTVRGIEPTF